MNFRLISKPIGFLSLLFILLSCGDKEDEARLINLHTTAAEDLISISFTADTETVLSINSEVDLSVQGLKSNGVDTVTLTNQIEWSLSEGAQSSINQQGHIIAAPVAESITVNAKLGILSAALDIRISAARFDKVVSLDADSISIQMCQSQTIKPIASYIDDSGNEEIRSVDSTVIDSIDWLILNAEDNTASQRAYIKTANNRTKIYGLAAGDVIVQASATSLYTGIPNTTSADFHQTIGNGLNSVKLCSSSATDYTSCSLTSPGVEKDQSISVIAIGNYPGSNGSTINQNITQLAKWGLSNSNLSAAFSSDLQQLNLTGNVESTNTTVTLACGKIVETVTGDITQGVIMDSTITCDTDCLSVSSLIDIDQLSVSSFQVTANNKTLTDNQSLTLDPRPNEIVLAITVTYSNGDREVITDASTLDYYIIPIDGQNAVIREKSNTPGTYTVLGAGTAKIRLFYRGEDFIVFIVLP